jgi:tetratricopeptide (TPR) repeat protein
MNSPRSVVLACGIVAALASAAFVEPAFGQAASGKHSAIDILKSFNFNREHKRMPFWQATSSEASQQLSKTARSVRDALVLVGHPEVGFATGFVISRANRLVATNAHVADIQAQMSVLYAVRNGTTDQYEVEKAYYHPAVIRIDPRGPLTRSAPDDPGAGKVFPFSADVAVLQLKAGPALPAEVSLATPDEIKDLWSLPVGMAGYPGTETRFPEKGKLVTATFHDGAIDHVSTFDRDVSADSKNNQMVEYTMGTWGGFSGSPVFLENGHVVAINNSHQTFHSGDMSTTQAYGIRIDCLWELLQHYPGLAQLVPTAASVDKEQMQRDVDQAPKPDQKAWDAIQLLNTARNKTPAQQKDICTQAIEKSPKLAYAYGKRGVAYRDIYYANLGSTEVTQADRLALLQNAANDFEQATKLDPNSVDAGLQLCLVAYLQAKELAGDGADFQVVLKHVNEILAMSSLSSRQRAVGLQIRSFCHGRSSDAERDLEDAIRLLPEWSENYRVRADYWTMLDQQTKAADDRARQKQIEGAIQKASAARDKALAWKKGHSTDGTVISGAIAEASAACAATDWKEWNCLDCLVHVCETKGDYDTAIHWAVEARKVAADVADQFHSVNDVYECRRGQKNPQ